MWPLPGSRADTAGGGESLWVQHRTPLEGHPHTLLTDQQWDLCEKPFCHKELAPPRTVASQHRVLNAHSEGCYQLQTFLRECLRALRLMCPACPLLAYLLASVGLLIHLQEADLRQRKEKRETDSHEPFHATTKGGWGCNWEWVLDYRQVTHFSSRKQRALWNCWLS